VPLIRLLGAPSIELDDEEVVSLRGKKVWALLAYLLLTERPAGRSHVAELLFEDADDPLRALRWALNELRRALPGTIGGDPLELELEPRCIVDAVVVDSGSWEEALALPSLGGELLEGAAPVAGAAFEAWLLGERRRMQAASQAILREGTVAFLGTGRHEEAISVAVRLVARDPLSEDNQELLIRAYAAAGDRASAVRQLEACRAVFQRELGIEPGESIGAALTPGPVSTIERPLGGVQAARAQLEAGNAAISAGAFEAGLDCLKRATLEAHSAGNLELLQESLLATGSALVHAGRLRQSEGGAALHEVIDLAARTERIDLEARACYELGWSEFLAASYGRAIVWLERARDGAGEDAALKAIATLILGKVRMETGRYAASLELIEEAIATTPPDESAGLGFALTCLGRTYLMQRDLEPAREVLERAVKVTEDGGALSLLPLPEAFLSEVLLVQGERDRAMELAEHAYALALQIGDATKATLAQRSLGIALDAMGRTDEAIDHLVEARRRLVLTPDHTASMAFALDALCAIAVRERHPEAARWVDDLGSLGGRTGMKEMICRSYLYRARLGSDEALATAASLAVHIDNPYLHRQIEDERSRTGAPASVGAWSSGASNVSRRTSSP